jgi:protoheme IX farnesyltransferase
MGLLGTLTGIAGTVYAVTAVAGGLWLAWLAFAFLRARTDARARALFLASLAYLPVLLGVMVADRGSIVPTGTREDGAVIIEVPAR